MLRDSQSFGDVNPTIFAHWIVCTIQFHIDDVELIILYSCCGPLILQVCTTLLILSKAIRNIKDNHDDSLSRTLRQSR